ncbi:hypothetical protein BD779DRAFT_1784863 [Infundibulicybe gibba]|nr:hypothetical protein BD779DRAFT_1784863 [Infundibulicybe gibba]
MPTQRARPATESVGRSIWECCMIIDGLHAANRGAWAAIFATTSGTAGAHLTRPPPPSQRFSLRHLTCAMTLRGKPGSMSHDPTALRHPRGEANRGAWAATFTATVGLRERYVLAQNTMDARIFDYVVIMQHGIEIL